MASWAVSLRTRWRAWSRGSAPAALAAASTSRPTNSARQRGPRRDGWSGGCGSLMAGLRARLRTSSSRAPLVDDGEERGHEQQRGDGREQQAADDGAAERRVLLATFPEAKRHRQHAD